MFGKGRNRFFWSPRKISPSASRSNCTKHNAHGDLFPKRKGFNFTDSCKFKGGNDYFYNTHFLDNLWVIISLKNAFMTLCVCVF